MFAPAGTVTLAGTTAAVVLLEVNAIAVPPAGAALPSVTVPVAFMPPATEVGETVTPLSSGVTVSAAVFETPL